MFGHFSTLCLRGLTKYFIHIGILHTYSLILNKSLILSGNKNILHEYFGNIPFKLSIKTAVNFKRILGEVKVKPQ